MDFLNLSGFVYNRKDSCYDFDFFTRHGVSVLEDLVISVADGVASMYVELISVDGDISDGINSLGLSLCSLSTRALQRLRNEVHLIYGCANILLLRKLKIIYLRTLCIISL